MRPLFALLILVTLVQADEKKPQAPAKHETPDAAVTAFNECVRTGRAGLLDHISADYKKKFIAQAAQTTAQSLADEPYLGALLKSNTESECITALKALATKYELDPAVINERAEAGRAKNRAFKRSGDREKDIAIVKKLFGEFLDSITSDLNQPELFFAEYEALGTKYFEPDLDSSTDTISLEDVKIARDKASATKC